MTAKLADINPVDFGCRWVELRDLGPGFECEIVEDPHLSDHPARTKIRVDEARYVKTPTGRVMTVFYRCIEPAWEEQCRVSIANFLKPAWELRSQIPGPEYVFWVRR